MQICWGGDSDREDREAIAKGMSLSSYKEMRSSARWRFILDKCNGSSSTVTGGQMEYLGTEMGRFGEVVMAACRCSLFLAVFSQWKRKQGHQLRARREVVLDVEERM